MKKTNNIVFRAQSEHVYSVRERPVPASSMMPDWWKDAPIYATKNQKLTLDPAASVTIKRCFPMLDAIGAGYIVPLWSDILISDNSSAESMALAKWAVQEPVLESWSPSQVSTFDFPEGYSRVVFKYLHGWTIKTPPGWSCLITHPIGYNNLPIKTLTGIVDTDILESDINSPFIIKSGFEGIIEKGTPMFQVIPFKRSDWQAEFVLEEENQLFFNREKLMTKIVSSYGRHMRQPKRYK